MTTLPRLSSPLLDKPGLAHCFFGRKGGVSKGEFASLNTGPGSGDELSQVEENRRRCSLAIGVAPDLLVTNYQIHSAEVITIDGMKKDPAMKADALVTKSPGFALGVLAADCMPWLFADHEASVIGAAHAGWRGALAGVLENTIDAMEKLGANRANISAALGPCLRQNNFEVGLELMDAFMDKHAESERFFTAGEKPEKRQLDLAGFGVWRLSAAGVHQVDDLQVCTLAEKENYFSYRASMRAGANNYGRNLSAIAIV